MRTHIESCITKDIANETISKWYLHLCFKRKYFLSLQRNSALQMLQNKYKQLHKSQISEYTRNYYVHWNCLAVFSSSKYQRGTVNTSFAVSENMLVHIY